MAPVVIILLFLATAAILTAGYRIFMMRRQLKTQRKIAIHYVEAAILQRIIEVGGPKKFTDINLLEHLDEHGKLKTGSASLLTEKKFGVSTLDIINRQIEEYRQFDCKEVASVATAGAIGTAVAFPPALIKIGVISAAATSTALSGALMAIVAAAFAFVVFYVVRYFRSRHATKILSKKVNKKLMDYSTEKQQELENLIDIFRKEQRKYSNIVDKHYTSSIQRQIEEGNLQQRPEVLVEKTEPDLEEFQQILGRLEKERAVDDPQRQDGMEWNAEQALQYTQRTEVRTPRSGIRPNYNPESTAQDQKHDSWSNKFHNNRQSKTGPHKTTHNKTTNFAQKTTRHKSAADLIKSREDKSKITTRPH
jgi:hypothetical protein